MDARFVFASAFSRCLKVIYHSFPLGFHASFFAVDSLLNPCNNVVMEYNSWKIIGVNGSKWTCECKCGAVVEQRKNDITTGKSKQCRRCYNLSKVGVSNAAVKTHGMTNSPTMTSWSEMKRRCYAEHRKEYVNYGGRGILVCQRWLDSFSNFLEDMGERPEGTTLERINNDAHYSKENCRWIPRREQEYNKRSSRKVNLNGEIMCLSQACSKFNANYYLTYARLRRGWSLERALNIED